MTVVVKDRRRRVLVGESWQRFTTEEEFTEVGVGVTGSGDDAVFFRLRLLLG
jgi:hypothetical protein